MRVLRRLERNAFQGPLFRLTDTDSDATVNRYCYSRVAIDYGVLTKQDTFSGCEPTRHGVRLGHEPMSLPVGAVSSRT